MHVRTGDAMRSRVAKMGLATVLVGGFMEDAAFADVLALLSANFFMEEFFVSFRCL